MQIQLQSVLWPRKDVCMARELYFHKYQKWTAFNGYLNLFCIEKWQRYTALTDVRLSLHLEGYELLSLYHDRERLRDIRLRAGEWAAYEVSLPYMAYHSGVFWFALKEAPDAEIKQVSGFYTGECENERTVKIGTVICTYNREAYVERSLKLLWKYILTKTQLDVSENVLTYVVDNARSLRSCRPVLELVQRAEGRIAVIPNRNSGGAGGFTRGMLQILEEQNKKQLTHVLLMDDDAVMEPDLFVRIYGFLSAVKEEWKDITLGGSMLLEDLPWMLHAAGEYWEKGIIYNNLKGMDLRRCKNAASQTLLAAGHEREYYSGWWCCCYSLRVVREDNLPMPVFIHHDDIEFGIRNRGYGTVFLHGVCVWHRNFENFPPGANLYYDIRNNLIELALQYTQGRAVCYIWDFFWKRLAVRLARARFDEAGYVLRGMLDFLKGPDWLWKQEPQRLHEKVRGIKITKMSQAVCCSLHVYRKMASGLWRAVRDYRQNMHRYTSKQAWSAYLDGDEKTKEYFKGEG